MALVRYEPWSLMTRIHEDLNRGLDPRPATQTTGDQVDWVPAVDLEEYDDRFELHVDLPGVAADDIDITLEAGVLTLAGKRNPMRSTDPVSHAHRERGTGNFHRRFLVPDTADAEGVQARSRDGVLAITIPKLARAQPRRIKVAA